LHGTLIRRVPAFALMTQAAVELLRTGRTGGFAGYSSSSGAAQTSQQTLDVLSRVSIQLSAIRSAIGVRRRLI
jgi:hypothetical protein